ncbi:hypothetical protein [Oceanobacillus kapialis]|uniref:hypothetical protein n=1 Tax=Oceanobacillus kapialis TaxID=481353 RepID=UPI00385117DD
MIITLLSIMVFICFLAILIVTWVFPYAGLSVSKSYTVKLDPIVVKQYDIMLSDYNQIMENSQDHSKTYTIGIAALDIFQEILVVDKVEWKVTEETLEELLFHVSAYREMLLSHAFSESYKEEAKMYLDVAVNASIELESHINAIQKREGLIRNDLRVLLRNLYGDIGGSFNHFITFYETVHNSAF